MPATTAVISVDIPGLCKYVSGKVREVFDLGDALLVVASDRISAFDVILPTGIPDKGRVLTQISLYWFAALADIVPHHVISARHEAIESAVVAAGGSLDQRLSEVLVGRSMLVKKAEALPIECVARGYLAGSLWNEYRQFPAHGGEVTINGAVLPVGMRESERLPQPIFTPATKAHSGHDENVPFERAAAIIGTELADRLRSITLALYARASELAAKCGIIIADTKFEFGLCGEELTWIDEALTPDSSRFWDSAEYRPGRPQASFDKQFVRDYLETLNWPKTAPGPELPPEIVSRTAEKYRESLRRLTGLELAQQ